jgi:hypothetical protein
MKNLCADCIGEQFLCEKVLGIGRVRKCHYCKNKGPSYTIEKLSAHIEKAFQQHYIRTPDQPDDFEYFLMRDRESDYEWWREGEKTAIAIQNAAGIPLDAASDIQELLASKYFDRDAVLAGEETEFDVDAHYERKNPDDLAWQTAWLEFEHSLKTQARFFSKKAAKLLADIFGGIDKMRTHDHRPLVVDAGPKTRYRAFYRARVFQSDDNLAEALKRPDRHIGPPPSANATGGRMNARGISVFYGSNRAMAAITEVRPPVGSRVVVARFQIVRPLRILDLTALDHTAIEGSIFVEESKSIFEKVRFLRSLSNRIVKPVMPDDEPSEYLTTQAIADFLSTENDPRLDGILFPSVQAGNAALNIVLFNNSSLVYDIHIPSGTDLSTRMGYTTEDGWDESYSVLEETNPAHVEPHRPPSAIRQRLLSAIDKKNREKTLKIDLSTICVHRIKSIRVASTKMPVGRERREKQDFTEDF